MDVITTHLNADFDALASMIAAKKYYPDAMLVFPGSQEESVREFLSVSDIKADITKIKDIDMGKIDRMILVDVKNPERIGRFDELLENKGLTIHIYDHHPFSEKDIRGEKEIIEIIGASTTIFIEMLRKDKKDISPEEATVFMIGIYEETGSLIFPSTTSRDLSAASWLLKKGANLNIVSSFIKKELSPEHIDLLNDLIQSSKEHLIHDVRIKIVTASRETYISDIASLAHRIKEIDDVDAVFMLVMMEDRLQMIARSRIPEVDVSEILHTFKGGGHPGAASAVIKDMSIEEAEQLLLKTLKENIHPSRTARDIMTSPVKIISWDETIKTAERTMTKYGVNVLPVLKQKRLYGLISREAVEKALFHGFGKNKLNEFCTTEVPVVSPSTPISIIESNMIEKNQRFMPVTENGVIVGAITRTDLLRSLYESLLRKNRISSGEKLSGKPSIGKNLTTTMKARLPEKVMALLIQAGEEAASLGYRAYLVGGSVRDMLRGEENLDLDIVIEGDGINFAKILGKKLNAKVKTHEKFGTAVVITDFLKFDVAGARTEYYEYPAALPMVETSSIKKDLYRRDFTINTLALELNPEHFGKLIDFFGGQRDIKEKTIRILHNLSFIEDPTRAFRAIRFSERFGFKISKHTKKLISTAVRINLFDKLSGTRMYDELNLLFTETKPVEAIKRLDEFGLLKPIHPVLNISETLEKRFDAIQETISWFKLQFFEENINRSHLFLMALLDELTPKEQNEALLRLQVPPNLAESMINGLENTQMLMKMHSWLPKETYHALHPLDIQTILYAMSKCSSEEAQKAISMYLTTLRNTLPEITGTDLIALGLKPGPLFKDILSALTEARIEEKVSSREDELDYIKNILKQDIKQ